MNLNKIVALCSLLVSLPLQAQTAESLIGASDCMECHEGSVGPSFEQITEKYNNDSFVKNNLIHTIKNGGKGNWLLISKGTPMPPYSNRLSDEEIELIVDWLLNL